MNKLIARRPHPHISFLQTGRTVAPPVFPLSGGGRQRLLPARLESRRRRRPRRLTETKNTAKQVIFLFLEGAPSHVDTFDLKEYRGVTPADFAPETIQRHSASRRAPGQDRRGPRQGGHHPLRFGVGAGASAGANLVPDRPQPHLGARQVRAAHRQRRRHRERARTAARPNLSRVHCANAGNIPGSGYFPTDYSPFKTAARAAGPGHDRTRRRAGAFRATLGLLSSIDGALRSADSPLGAAASGTGQALSGARSLMFNPLVARPSVSPRRERALRRHRSATPA